MCPPQPGLTQALYTTNAPSEEAIWKESSTRGFGVAEITETRGICTNEAISNWPELSSHIITTCSWYSLGNVRRAMHYRAYGPTVPPTPQRLQTNEHSLLYFRNTKKALHV